MTLVEIVLVIALTAAVIRWAWQARRPRRAIRIAVAVLATLAGLFAIQVIRYAPDRGVGGVIEEVSASPTNGLCTHVTQTYLEQQSGEHGPPAFGQCLTFPYAFRLASEVAINDVHHSGGEATAEVTYRNGIFAGSTVQVRLARVDGNWELDRIVEFTNFDEERFLDEVRNFVPPTYGFSGPATNCVLDGLRSMGDSHLQEALIADHTKLLNSAYVDCDRGAMERHYATSDPPGSGSAKSRSCVMGTLAKLTRQQLAGLVSDTVQWRRVVLDCGREGYLDNYAEAVMKAQPTIASCYVDALRAQPNSELAETLSDPYKRDEIRDRCES